MDIIKILFEKNVNVETLDNDKFSALDYSTKYLSVEMFEKFVNLLDQKNCMHMFLHRPRGNVTTLHNVVMNMELTDNTIQQIASQGYFDEMDSLGRTALYYAVSGKRSVEMLKHLVQICKFFQIDEEGHNILHTAVAMGTLEAITFFLDLDEDDILKKYQAEDGKSPLHHAVQRAIDNSSDDEREERFQIVRVLLHSGIDIRALDTQGLSALHYAGYYDAPEIFELFAEYTATNNCMDAFNDKSFRDHLTPLHSAVGNFELTDKTMELISTSSKIDLNSVNVNGFPVLFYAVTSQRDISFVKRLANLCQWDIADNLGRNILHIAAEYGNIESVQHFMKIDQEGILLQTRTMTGHRTPIHLAICRETIKSTEQQTEKREILRLLYNKSINFVAGDPIKCNVLYHAAVFLDADMFLSVILIFAGCPTSEGIALRTSTESSMLESTMFESLRTRFNNWNEVDDFGNNILHLIADSGAVTPMTIFLEMDNTGSMKTLMGVTVLPLCKLSLKGTLIQVRPNCRKNFK